MSQVSYGTITISDLTDGNKWYSGTLIAGTGSNITPSFPSTDTTYYIEGDRYLNTNNYNIYVCITDGTGSQSRWSYTGNVQGDQGVGIETLIKQYKYIDPTEFEREYGPYNNIESLPGFEDKNSGSSSENIVLGGTYYSRDKITWTDTSVTETEWVIDYGLMSDYANRLQEQKIAEVELKARHFTWSDAAYVIMGDGWNPVINSAADEELPSIDIYDPDDKNTYGYHSRNGVDGISFRHNDTILGQLTSDGLNFYYTDLISKVEPKTVTYINSSGQEQTVTHDYEAIEIVQGLKGLTLNKTGLYLYPNRNIAEDQTTAPLVELNNAGLYLNDIEGTNLISLTNGGQIRSGNYKPLTDDNTFSAQGTLIDLTNGAIHTPSFYTDGISDSYFRGHIDALSGTIGGFNISAENLQKINGPIISFNGEANTVVKSLLVDIEPKQSFNGYDHPWVGGGGKNLLYVEDETKTFNGVTFTSNNGVIHAVGTATASAQFSISITVPKAGNYYFSGAPSGYGGKVDEYVWNYATNSRAKKWDGTSSSVSDTGVTSNNEVRFEESGTYSLLCRVTKGTTVDAYFHPMIRLASETDSTFEPYENICPITGWDEVNAPRTGKNLCPTNAPNSNGTWNASAEELTVSGTSSYNSAYYRLVLKAGNTYTFSAYAKQINGKAKIGLRIGDITQLTISSQEIGEPGRLAFTYTPVEDIDARFTLFSAWGTAVQTSVVYGEIQIEVGSTATAYEPYQGSTITTNLPQTVYGGVLDVVSGALTVDTNHVDLGSLDWITVSPAIPDGFGARARFTGRTIGTDVKAPICEAYTFGGVGTTSQIANRIENGEFMYQSTNNFVWFRNDAYSTVADLKESLSGVYAIFERAEPIEIQLTPTEVKTLLGANNIWADAGTVEITVGSLSELTNGNFFINPAGKVLDNKSDIVLSIGNNFKVDKNGNLYAANANLEGFTIGFNQVTGLNQQFSSINTQLSAHNNDITQLGNNINDTKIELSQTIEAKTQGKLDSSEFNTFKTKNNETVNSITGDITNLKTDNESFNSSLSSLQGQTQQNTEDISKFQGMIKTDKETDESSQKIHPYILITSEETNQEGTEIKNMTGLKLRDDRISFQVGSNNQITTPGYITATTLVMGEINVSQVENFGRYGIEERTGGTEGTHFSIIINDTEENN